MSMNIVILQGRLTKDPEKRYTQSQKPVTSFTLSVDRDYNPTGEKETDFIPIVAWSKTADFAAQYFSKGSLVIVQGRMQVRTWTDKDGNKRKETEVIADRVYFGESKKRETAVDVSAADDTKYSEMEEPEGQLPF